MILILLIAILLIGGIASWMVGIRKPEGGRWISLVSLLANFFIVISIWINHYALISLGSGGNWLIEFMQPWIPRFGIDLHLAMDGLSLILITLTFFLGILSILVSWKQIKSRVGFFHFNILWILAGISGVFLSMDMFLFYFFWEVMLIPMYFIIGIWGHENRIYAAYKFFIFTQASGLLMFAAILGLYFIHGTQTGIYTFDAMELINTSLAKSTALLLMSGFMIAFLVKLPAVPFHNWLPDAHTEAPTAGSVILAGLLLKTGAYGMLRFVVPFFPEAVNEFSTYGMLLGVIGILYGAKLAFAQTDLKRLVAYSSVSHMGFVMLGVFALNELAFQGVVMQIVAHGISTGALFIMVGVLQERTHTRDIEAYSGLWSTAPKMGAIGLIFAMASLGLPGMGNFIAEFLILVGAYKANIIFTSIAALGLIAATLYSLRVFQKVFQGSNENSLKVKDHNIREMVIMGAMIIAIVWLGVYPQPVLNTTASPIKALVNYVKPHEAREVIEVENKVIHLQSDFAKIKNVETHEPVDQH